MKKLFLFLMLLAVWGSVAAAVNAVGASTAPSPPPVSPHILPGHVAPRQAQTRPAGPLAGTNSLRLAISLPMRNQDALAGLLRRLYDPSSQDYRHYLTPEQFSAQFGPTDEDYQTVLNFAKAKGLTIEATHRSRLLVDVRGKVSDIENAFHVKLQTYQHPTEARTFHAPTTEPWVEADLPVLNVAGLSDYAIMRRTIHGASAAAASGTADGSGPNGEFLGQDFRNAYAPGVSLTGAGQVVGLFEADGYYSSDITNYEGWCNPPLPDVPLQNVLIDNFSGTPGSGNSEVAVDIEMAISMAPGLAAVVVFECTNSVNGIVGGTEVQYWLDTLDAMASDSQIKQFSSAWGYTGGNDPNTSFDAFFQQMAAQGQCFFQASGDGDAWTTPVWVPADSPYVVSVGGTSLATSGGAYSSETVWNSGTSPDGTSGDWFAGGDGYWGSGGGVSTVYSIPSWQTSVSMAANQGSTSMRNIPDVALTAANIFVAYNNGVLGDFIGTSCSSPLWAGYEALINEQAANASLPPAGFLNPALYALGQGPNYNLCFHDITSGNNTSSGSPGNYSAVPGYDLCTGWGTPVGSNLINALAGIYQPGIAAQPANQSGTVGGSASLNVTAGGVGPFTYQWQLNGTSISGANSPTLVINNLTEANAGRYTVVVANQWGSVTSSAATLTIGKQTPAITWANPSSIVYGTALSSGQLNATATVSGTFAYTPASGTVLSAGTHALSVLFTPSDATDYTTASATVSIVVTPAPLTITANNRVKTYGQPITFAGTEFSASGLVNGDAVSTVTLVSPGALSTATVSGSPYSITPSAAAGSFTPGNYTITYAPGGLTVTPAPVTVTANSLSKTYGLLTPFGSSTLFTATGLQNSETIGSVTLAVAGNGGAATASVAGSPYAITASAATGGSFSPGNYTITYAPGTLTVNPAPATVIASPQSKTYGQPVSFGSGSTLFSATGLQNSETIGSVTLAVAGNGGAPTASVAGSPYAITASAATGGSFTPGNYTVAYAPGTLTVNPAPVTVTAGPQSKTYGQPVSFGSGSTLFSATGLQNSETIGSVTLAVAGNGGAPTASVAGSPYAITASAATGGSFTPGNYTVAYAPGTLTVNPAPVTVTAGPQSKTYGQPVSFGSGSTLFSATGLQNSETIGSVTLAVAGNGGAATASVAGSPYAITASAATGGSFTPGNYTIAYANGNLTVSPVALTITANSRSKLFGQTVTFAGTEFSASGLFNGDTVASVTLSSAGAAASATVAGSPYPIVPSAAAGTGLGNYTISYVNGLLTVTAGGLAVTWSTPNPITYGAPLTASQLNASANVAGNFAYTPTNGSVLNSGTNTLTAVFTPNDLVDYKVVTNTVQLVVNPAPLSITAANANRVYGQANPAFTTILVGVTNGDSLTAGATCGATVASGVGAYSIIPSAAAGNDLTNYSITYADGTLTVAPAGLAITAKSRGKTYGQTVNFAGTEFTASGLVNGDAVSTVTLTSSGAAATATVSGSPYGIVPSAALGSGLANYTIAYVSGNLTVSPVALTITANSRSKPYGQTVTFAGTEFTASGLVNGDAVSTVTLTSSGAAATATVSGSPYSIVPSAALGSGLANYTIAYVSGNLTVSPAGLTITANSRSKPYGQTVTFAGTEFTASGLVNGDAVSTVTLTSSGAAATATVSSSPYGIVPSAALGSGLANYTIAYANGNLTVSPVALTITANSRSKPYGQTVTFAGTEFTASGLVNGDAVSTVTLTSSGAAATATVSSSPYGIVPSAALGSGLANYTIAYVSGNLTVSPATLTITANSRSKPYGQTVTFAGTEFTASGLVNGDAVSTVTLTSSGAAATATVSSSPYGIVPSAALGSGLANYTIAYVSGNLTVSPAGLTITANSRSKPYGQTVTFAGTEFTASGLVNGDAVSTVTLTSSGAAATATVTVSPYSIVPSAALGSGLANYTIAYANGNLTVSPVALTITANSRSKLFGQTVTFAGTEFSASGLFNGDTVASVTLSSAGAAASATVAGSPYPIVPSAAAGTGLGNYTISYVNGLLTVTAGGLAVTWSTPNPITYGAPLTASQLNASANVAGNFAYTPTNGSVLNSGTNTLTAVFTPNDLVDYKVVTNTVQLVVNPAPLSITAANANRVYGQANPAFTTILVGVTNGDSLTAGATCGATVASGVGAYSIIPSAAAGNDLTNYSITYADGTLTVAPAGLAITAKSRGKTYGQTVNFAGTEFTASGLVNGDAVSTVTLTSSGAAATATVSGSPYGIVPSAALGSGLANYTIAYVSGNLTVSPVALTITANSRSKPYGQTVTFAGTEFTASGLVNGDAVSTVTLTSSGAAATATVSGSPYGIVPSAALGSGLANYTIAYVSGNLTVSPAGLTITANSRSKPYGQTVTFAGTEFTASGLVNGDAVSTVTLTSSGAAATATVSSSPYGIVPSAALGSGLANYTIAYVSGNLTVSPAGLTITANSRSKPYGQTVTFAGTEFTASGLVNGDAVSTVTLTSSGAAATATVTVSPYSIVPSAALGSGLANYTIAYANGNLTVSPVALTITANSRSKLFGQTVTFAGTEFSASGLFNGDTVASVTLSSAGAAASATVAGSPYPIVPSAAAGTGLGNYTISYVNGLLTVTAGGLAVTWSTPNPITYGAPLTASQLNASANVAGNFAYTPTNGSVLNSGTNTLTAVFTPNDLVDYKVVTNTVQLVVNPAPLSITAANANRVYGQANPAFTTILVGVTNGDSLTAGATCGATVASGVGAYSIIPSTAAGNDLTNYSVTYDDGTLTVAPAALTITANNSGKTYGQTATLAATAFTASGLANGDAVSTVTLTSSGAGATATVTGSPYAIIPSAAVGAGLANYTIAYANGTLSVSPAPLTITANNRAKTYGQPVTFAGTEFVEAGLFNNDSVNSVNLTSAGAAATATVTSSPYSITPSAASGSGLANYTITYTSGTLTVSPAMLTITANNRGKPYGQTVTFAGTEFTANGLVNGDAVSTVTLTSSGAAPTATVTGSPYSIVPSAALGSGLANYTIAFANGNLTVSPVTLTITANNRVKTFGQTVTFAGTEFSVNGLFNGDTVTSVTLTSPGAPASATAAGSPYPIVPSAAVGTGLGNYNITYINGLLTVTAGGLVVAWSTPTPITYGAPLTSSQLNASASVAGNFAYTPASGSILNTGTNTLMAVFTPNDLVDYNVVTNTVQLVVNPAPLSITAANANRVYGQVNPTFTTILVGVANGDSVTAGATCGASVASGVGAYSIIPSTAVGSDLTNYSITYADGALTVAPAALTITAKNQSKTFGQTLTFMGTEFTASGLVNGDAVSAVTLTSAGAAASATVAGSPYPIEPSAAVGTGLGNYSISYVDGFLAVTSVALQPAIQSVAQFGNSLTFAWTTTPSEKYQIQYTTNLSQTIWANLGGPLTANGSTLIGSDTITAGPTFYRIMVVP